MLHYQPCRLVLVCLVIQRKMYWYLRMAREYGQMNTDSIMRIHEFVTFGLLGPLRMRLAGIRKQLRGPHHGPRVVDSMVLPRCSKQCFFAYPLPIKVIREGFDKPLALY